MPVARPACGSRPGPLRGGRMRTITLVFVTLLGCGNGNKPPADTPAPTVSPRPAPDAGFATLDRHVAAMKAVARAGNPMPMVGELDQQRADAEAQRARGELDAAFTARLLAMLDASRALFETDGD